MARPPARRSRPSTPGRASSSLRGPGATFFDRPALRFLTAVRHRVIPLSESRKAACLASPARVGRHNHFRSQAPRLIGSRASGPASKAITPHVPTMGKWVSSSRIKVGLHSLFRGCSSWGPNDNGTFQIPVWFGAGAYLTSCRGPGTVCRDYEKNLGVTHRTIGGDREMLSAARPRCGWRR